MIESSKQKAGDNSTQILGTNGNVIVNYGADFATIKGIFELLLENNFPKLVDKANATARENIEKMYIKLEEKINQEINKISIEKIASVDTQYIMNKSIQNVARRGEKIDLDYLTSLLMEKFKENNDEFDILINEALEISEKISKNELQFLIAFNFYFYLKLGNVIYPQLMSYLEAFNNFISYKILKIIPNSLIWKGLATMIPGMSTRGSLRDIMEQNYPFLKEQNLDNCILTEIYHIDESSMLRSVNLTELGKLVALTGYKNFHPEIKIQDLLYSQKFM